MKYYLYIIFIALSFSNEQFTQKPLDYRAKTIQLNKKYIPSDSDLQQYFDRGIILDKDSTIEITIHTDDGIKARFDKKLLKKLKAVPSLEIRKRRVRVPNYQKAGLLAQCYVSCRLNLI